MFRLLIPTSKVATSTPALPPAPPPVVPRHSLLPTHQRLINYTPSAPILPAANHPADITRPDLILALHARSLKSPMRQISENMQKFRETAGLIRHTNERAASATADHKNLVTVRGKVRQRNSFEIHPAHLVILQPLPTTPRDSMDDYKDHGGIKPRVDLMLALTVPFLSRYQKLTSYEW
ncbi:uncharacterized protein N7483_009522 [Penicillium malachiteum]|uniref:uncharacterized protein n=1 Tax=Penicillium malachiteum TaxID=1324776 RepID=UPI002547FF7F|nr:uncharacterized protein N7483_009522 [Penicillium malachiteum]KAJ5721588.1 hypothetical protein N7483_009522 [Penicillium malachiteum]